MPYIDPARRAVIDSGQDQPATAGELAYVLSTVVARYQNHVGLRFQTISDVNGALDATEQEFKRCVQNPYEDAKRRANGPVFAEQARCANL